MLRLCIHSFPCLALILRNYKLLYQHSVCHPPKKGQHETTRYQRNNGKVPRTHKNEKCTFEKFDIPPKWLHPQQSDRQTRSTLSPTQPNSTPSTPNPTSPREENLHQTHTQNHPPKAATPPSPATTKPTPTPTTPPQTPTPTPPHAKTSPPPSLNKTPFTNQSSIPRSKKKTPSPPTQPATKSHLSPPLLHIPFSIPLLKHLPRHFLHHPFPPTFKSKSTLHPTPYLHHQQHPLLKPGESRIP